MRASPSAVRRVGEQEAPRRRRRRARRGRAAGGAASSPKRSASSTIITVAFGHVDADLDDGRRDEHVELAGAERAPSPLPSPPTGIWPCSSPSRRPRELLGLQPLELLGRGLGLDLARCPRRAGTRRTPGGPAATSARTRSYTRRCARAGSAPTTSVAIGVRPGRHLAQLGLVEVAVDEHRRGARDRRRRHHEHVGLVALARAAARAARRRSDAARRSPRRRGCANSASP